MVARTLGKQQTVMAIATKIALQMNCKMGGELWRVDMPVSASPSGDVFQWFEQSGLTVHAPGGVVLSLTPSTVVTAEAGHDRRD